MGPKAYVAANTIAAGALCPAVSAFKGLEAHCLKRGEKRMFRVDRILELKVTAL